jgi:hypothetical protein
MSDIHLGNDAAVMGGVHSDSHDIHNVHNTSTVNNITDNSVVNNKTVYEAQRTYAELLQDNEKSFLFAVQERLADGYLDQRELAELSQLSIQYHIPAVRADEIIEKVRRSALVIKGNTGNEYLTYQLLNEVFCALQSNQTEVLRRRIHTLGETARNSQNQELLYYYNMLLASFSPEVASVNVLSSRADDYWQLYWAHIANVKLRNLDTAAAILPKLGGFGHPQGDIALLMAIDNLADFKWNGGLEHYHSQAERYLEQAVQYGLSEQISPLWYAVQELLKTLPQPEEWFKFYVEQTLRELVTPQSLHRNSKSMQVPPPMPQFKAQEVCLDQMQGWNALNAARQIGLGQMCSMNMSMPGSQTPPPLPSAPAEFMVNHASDNQIVAQPRDPYGDVDAPDLPEPHYGIILTDSYALSKKYGCSVYEALKLLKDFIRKSDEQQMYWSLLDIAELNLADHSWVAINAEISAFIIKNNLKPGPDLHLMIVGGDDVIPIPLVQDPYEHGSCGVIPTDLCYSFSDTYITDILAGEELALDMYCARNNVARLPLEDGMMNTSIHEDLGAYFNVSGLYAGGIPVGNVVMSSNFDWIPASATMSEHLPLLCSADDPELVKDGMYISPKLLTKDSAAMNIYCSSLKRADMLMFNLHGADSPGMSGFYSNDEAFNTNLLQVSNARVFNTVACYGARYKGYSREQSMLLKALYGGGVLLYTGSLVPVPMYYDHQMNEARELLLNPGTGSEVFMRLYPLYQFKGMTAGKALLKARCDYFNMCRHVESDGFSFSTALMFGLYGNPMLHVRERKHVIESALQNDALPPAPIKAEAKSLSKTIKHRLIQKDCNGSLLDQVRGYVDENLSAIRGIVEKHLYNQLGLPPRNLESIDQFSRPVGNGDYELGYFFNYHNPYAAYSADTCAETDTIGNIKRIYTSK